MRKVRIVRIVGLMIPLALGILAVPASSGATGTETTQGAIATVRDANGVTLGTVTLIPVSGKLLVAGRLTGLAAGFHGFHIHSVGLCDAPAFTTAGAHLNPTGAVHGNHAGDLPLLKVSADGVAVSVTETDSVTLAQILDADGAAFIVHALPDNYANIPTRYSAGGVPGPDAATLGTGDSGGRVACGVITQF